MIHTVGESISLGEAIDEYLLTCEARKLSPHTVSDYRNTYRKFVQMLPVSTSLGAITTREFLSAATERQITDMNSLEANTLWDEIVFRHSVSATSKTQTKPSK